MKGLFITFEGIEGCGKSTQVKQLASHLKRSGFSVIVTREPGGTEIGEAIRSILLNANYISMSKITELLLYAASRHQHISEKILPAINDGNIVISDRYADATTAYQGAARAIPDDVISTVHEIATNGAMPDLTLLLDCPADIGLARVRNRSGKDIDRLERESIEFHENVRNGYLNIAKNAKKRVKILDATMDIDSIHNAVVNEIDKLMGLRHVK